MSLGCPPELAKLPSMRPLSRSIFARRCQIWLVALATLVSACMPTLALAWGGHSQSAHWVAVCSAQGVKWVAIAAEAAPAEGSDEGEQAIVHCPWCLSHAPALAAPPAANVVSALPPATVQPVPAACLHGPRDQHAWSPRQSRAPPQA